MVEKEGPSEEPPSSALLGDASRRGWAMRLGQMWEIGALSGAGRPAGAQQSPGHRGAPGNGRLARWRSPTFPMSERLEYVHRTGPAKHFVDVFVRTAIISLLQR